MKVYEEMGKESLEGSALLYLNIASTASMSCSAEWIFMDWRRETFKNLKETP